MTDKLDDLIAIMARLRAPGGCAWDGEQTHESLVRYLIEETYELVDAIESGNRDELLEELGDVLYQVVFHADIASHTPGEGFDIQDVADHMAQKMVGRHPHVFGDVVAETADDVVAIWDELKSVEKPGRTSVLDGVPRSMPALALADKLIGRAQKVGVRAAVAGAHASATTPVTATAKAAETTDAPTAETEDELGAQLLAIVSAAAVRGLDSERALRTALRGLEHDIRRAEASLPAL